MEREDADVDTLGPDADLGPAPVVHHDRVHQQLVLSLRLPPDDRSTLNITLNISHCLHDIKTYYFLNKTQTKVLL